MFHEAELTSPICETISLLLTDARTGNNAPDLHVSIVAHKEDPREKPYSPHQMDEILDTPLENYSVIIDMFLHCRSLRGHPAESLGLDFGQVWGAESGLRSMSRHFDDEMSDLGKIMSLIQLSSSASL
jgi:hypothetical protein